MAQKFQRVPTDREFRKALERMGKKNYGPAPKQVSRGSVLLNGLLLILFALATYFLIRLWVLR